MLALVVEGGSATGELDVPPTIQALLGARLDRLSEQERAVIEPAAVVGKVFYAGAVVELVSASVRNAVGEALGSLVRKELIRPDRPSLGERTYRFRHILIRDAAYESIPKQTRAVTHERLGRWLERTAGDRASEYEELVGYHLEHAYLYRREFGATVESDTALAHEAAERLGRAARSQRASSRSVFALRRRPSRPRACTGSARRTSKPIATSSRQTQRQPVVASIATATTRLCHASAQGQGTPDQPLDVNRALS
jgi:predicted ATPase